MREAHRAIAIWLALVLHRHPGRSWRSKLLPTPLPRSCRDRRPVRWPFRSISCWRQNSGAASGAPRCGYARDGGTLQARCRRPETELAAGELPGPLQSPGNSGAISLVSSANPCITRTYTDWCATQSGANHAHVAVPCYSGNLQGISNSGLPVAADRSRRPSVFRHMRRNSLKTEQGNFAT